MKPLHTQNTPQFTRRQLEWLEGVFAENLTETATFEELLRSQGKRVVIAKVRSLVELSEKKGVV